MAQVMRRQPSSSNSAIVSITKSKFQPWKCSPNVLPCRINHDGPVNAAKRYWDPTTEADGTKTAYFRGRKLRGKTIQLPEGYRGAVLRKSDIDLTQTIHPPPEERYCDPLDEGEEVETTTMEEFATFEDITIWGHETVPEDADNPYAKGIQEWIEFAQAMHNWEPAPVEISEGTETLENTSPR